MNEPELWKPDPAEENTDYVVHFVDPEGWWAAWAKYDGCVHLNHYHNAPKGDARLDDTDYVHICDLDDAIKRLTELRDKIKGHFVPRRGCWPD